MQAVFGIPIERYHSVSTTSCTELSSTPLEGEMTMSKQSIENNRKKGISGVAVPAGIFIGMGIGFLVDNIAAGLFLGLGGGFLGMIVLRIILGEW